MARVILSLPIRRTDDSVLYVNTTPSLEVFRTATYATANGTSSTSLAVAQIGGIVAGDTVYVGTNAAVAVSTASATSGAGTLTLASALTWSNNDAVVVKRKTGEASDAYATIYDDPDFATSLDQPRAADSENEWTFYAKPGRYGVRYSNSSNATLRLDTGVSWDELDWVQVSPSHDSPTAGIYEAAKSLGTGGGVVYLPPGTYTLTDAMQLNSTFGPITFRGASKETVTVKIGNSATITTTTGGRTSMFGFNTVGDPIVIENITFDGNKANNTAANDLVYLQSIAKAVVRNCRFTGISNTSGDVYGLLVLGNNSVENIDIYNNHFDALGDTPTGSNDVVAIRVSSPTSLRQNSIRIFENVIDNCPDAGYGHAIQIGGSASTTDDVLIANNFIRDYGTNGAGTQFGNGIQWDNLNKVAIVGNWVDNVIGDAIGGSDSTDVVVSGNLITNSREGGIEISGAQRCSVSGNTVSGCDNAGISIAGGSGQMASYVSITGNAVFNCGADSTYGGIMVRTTTGDSTPSSYINITGNVTGDTRSGGSRTQDYGILLTRDGGGTGTFTNVVLSGNICFNNVLDGIKIGYASECDVRNNQCPDNTVYGISVGDSSDVIIEDNSIIGSGTQAIKDRGVNTRLKIGYNLTGTDENTAMSGTGTLAGGGTLTVPAAGTNPLIRADGTMHLAIGYGETPGAGTYLYPSTISTGSFVLTGAASKKITWRILEVGSTA